MGSNLNRVICLWNCFSTELGGKVYIAQHTSCMDKTQNNILYYSYHWRSRKWTRGGGGDVKSTYLHFIFIFGQWCDEAFSLVLSPLHHVSLAVVQTDVLSWPIKSKQLRRLKNSDQQFYRLLYYGLVGATRSEVNYATKLYLARTISIVRFWTMWVSEWVMPEYRGVAKSTGKNETL